MITICEPQCKGFSHEKVNSGFLHGLRMAFPQEKLRLHAHPTHIAALKAILTHDGISLENIEYHPIEFTDTDSFRGLFSYWRLLKMLFSEAVKKSSGRIFFLSFSPPLLRLMKQLKRSHRFRELKIALVLHGSFESLATPADSPLGPLKAIPTIRRSIGERLRISGPFALIRAVLQRTSREISLPRALLKSWYRERETLLGEHSPYYRYLILSPHALKNAAGFIDTEHLGIRALVLPTNFQAPLPAPKNPGIVFGIFGYGNSTILYNLALILNERKILRPYEIRVIGMDNRGADILPRISCPSSGKPLFRTEMERLARDVDMFLILYDRTRYRLSCSGSVLEALSLMKPVLHFENDCIDFFNRAETPIGIRCKSLEEMAGQMVRLIDTYPDCGVELERYRDNLFLMREECDIAKAKHVLERIFL